MPSPGGANVVQSLTLATGLPKGGTGLILKVLYLVASVKLNQAEKRKGGECIHIQTNEQTTLSGDRCNNIRASNTK